MEFAYAMLAEAATIEGGKLQMIGGDFDTIPIATFPAIKPSMAIVAKVAADAQRDVGPHTIRVSVADPQGNILPNRLEFNFEVAHSETQASTIGAMFVFEMISFPLPSAGVYTFLLSVDDRTVTRVLTLTAKQLNQ